VWCNIFSKSPYPDRLQVTQKFSYTEDVQLCHNGKGHFFFKKLCIWLSTTRQLHERIRLVKMSRHYSQAQRRQWHLQLQVIFTGSREEARDNESAKVKRNVTADTF